MGKWIDSAAELVEAASKENFNISQEQAALILGYMEGHDYVLGLDEAGNLIRNDMAYSRNKAHWEPYSVREAIFFVEDMNDDLLESAREADRIASFQTDRNILSPLFEAAWASLEAS